MQNSQFIFVESVYFGHDSRRLWRSYPFQKLFNSFDIAITSQLDFFGKKIIYLVIWSNESIQTFTVSYTFYTTHQKKIHSIQGVPERSIRFDTLRMLYSFNIRGYKALKLCDKRSLVSYFQNDMGIFVIFDVY